MGGIQLPDDCGHVLAGVAGLSEKGEWDEQQERWESRQCYIGFCNQICTGMEMEKKKGGERGELPVGLSILFRLVQAMARFTFVVVSLHNDRWTRTVTSTS